jgi:hypothetical protein
MLLTLGVVLVLAQLLPTPDPRHVDFPPNFNPENLLYFEEPVPLLRLRIRGADGTSLWEIERKTAQGNLASLQYGTLPAGFSLRVPLKGKPRPFVPNENLAVLYVFPSGIVCHCGTAVGQRGFMPGVYSSMPVNHPKNAAADKAFAENLECQPYGLAPKE